MNHAILHPATDEVAIRVPGAKVRGVSLLYRPAEAARVKAADSAGTSVGTSR